MSSSTISGALAKQAATSTAPVRVAIVCDLLEENWPSMNLVGDMLFRHLSSDHNQAIAPTLIRPSLPRTATVLPRNASRLYGRFITYARELRSIRDSFDIFHIVDHSYAHLVHQLPPDRTIVTCHDLDTFRSVLTSQEPRSAAFRAMTRRILAGLQKAAHITCDTAATRDAILQHKLAPAEKLTIVHNGVHPQLGPNPDPATDNELSRLLRREPGSCLELLHVGSTIARKRIPDLLRIFKAVTDVHPNARLIRVGTPFTAEQEQIALTLNIRDQIDTLEGLSVPLLASAYRRASVVLQPSDAEGFGLPVIEALACGTPVVASDIPALREVGGNAARYCPVGDINTWSNAVIEALSATANRDALIRHAARFSWNAYAAQMTEIYQQVLR